MTQSSYTATGCCWRLLHWDQSRSGRRNHNANRCKNIAYLDNFRIFIRTSFRLCHSRQGWIPDHCLQPLAGMGRRKGQNSEIILIWKFAKPDEDHPASYILHKLIWKFAKPDEHHPASCIAQIIHLTKIRLKRFVATTASTWRWPTGGRRWRRRWPRWSVQR